MKYYRVKFGFGADDFYSVDENELPKAFRAMAKGTVFTCSEGMVAGNLIQTIRPDFNRALGYNREYQMGSEDYAELDRGERDDYERFLEDTKYEALGEPNPRLTDGL